MRRISSPSRRHRLPPAYCQWSKPSGTAIFTTAELKVMAKSFTQNEKAPQRGFSTLAHAGDPTPVNWIDKKIYHSPRPAILFFPPQKNDRPGYSCEKTPWVLVTGTGPLNLWPTCVLGRIPFDGVKPTFRHRRPELKMPTNPPENNLKEMSEFFSRVSCLSRFQFPNRKS